MCGIHLQLWANGASSCSKCREIVLSGQHHQQQQFDNLRRRGPDSCQGVDNENDKNHDNNDKSVNDHGHALHHQEESSSSSSSSNPPITQIQLQASVLQMRHELVQQPVEIAPNHFLCWNGEVYQSLQQESAWDYDTCDTQLVATELRKSMILESSSNGKETETETELLPNQVAAVMSQLYNAEFAFVIWTPSRIYYGRDGWGRRSLLQWDCEECGSVHIVSTAEESPATQEEEDEEEEQLWKEILPGMVHCISLGGMASFKEKDEEDKSVPYPSISFSSPTTPTLFTPSDPSGAPEGVSDELWKASLELEFHLTRAVAMRMDTTRSTAVLFSGGLDSAVLAALAAKKQSTSNTHHPLTLYNVSFGPTYEKSADRRAALITYQALQEQHDNHIRYRDIIVDWDDICQNEPHIRTLLQPKTTLMDVNIATALWFASRGGRSELENPEDRPRVLLLGMGADEQLGGYGRHRKAFDRGGAEELRRELEMDQERFWERNLGRDDRICADHGKEARFPFLDAHVVQFLNRLPLDMLCDFSLPPGQGDKRILRLVAMRLGLDHASGLVKRAIQFGSRISHLSDAKRFGSRRKAKGQATVKKGVV